MTVEESKIMKTQNKAYVSMRYAMDKKKAEKLQNGLHFIGAKVVFLLVFSKNKNVSTLCLLDLCLLLYLTSKHLHAMLRLLVRIFLYWKAHNSHTLFFEDEAEAEQFQAAPHEHFDTVPELMETSYNRVRKVTLTLTPTLTLTLGLYPTPTPNPNPKP